MEAAAESEGLFPMRRNEADAVVGNRESEPLRTLFGRNSNTKLVIAPELDGIVDQVLKQLTQLGRVTLGSSEVEHRR